MEGRDVGRGSGGGGGGVDGGRGGGGERRAKEGKWACVGQYLGALRFQIKNPLARNMCK